MKNNPYKTLLSHLSKRRIYTWDDLLALIDKEGQNSLQSHYRWIVYQMAKEGLIKRIGRGKYIKADDHKTYVSEPLSASAASSSKVLKKSYPDMSFVIFESSALNEWLNELIARPTIIIEVDSNYLEEAYYALAEKTKLPVLLKPNEKEMTHYRVGKTIVIEPLFSRAPVQKDSHSPSLEQLMVDLVADRYFSYFFSQSELPEMYESMISSYIVNRDSLFSYAKRRRVYEKMLPLLPPSFLGNETTNG
jgi:Uma2 family endonuclease